MTKVWDIIVGAGVALGGIMAALYYAPQVGRSFGIAVPDYELVAEPDTLLLGKTATVSLQAIYADNVKDERPYSCTWTFTPQLPIPQQNNGCSIKITNVATLFKTGDPEKKGVMVSAQVTLPGGSAVAVPHAMLTLHNLSPP